MSESKKKLIFNLILITLCLSPAVSHALTAPAKTDFAYDIYDVGVNKLLKGPIGFVGGITMLVTSAVNITKNWVLAALGILGGTAIVKADTLVTSMGMLMSSL
ncbi:MAG: hypothetical protein U1E78_13080 [Gammaproteobacteria bacterium]